MKKCVDVGIKYNLETIDIKQFNDLKFIKQKNGPSANNYQDKTVFVSNFQEMENYVNNFRNLIDQFSVEASTKNDRYLDIDKINNTESIDNVQIDDEKNLLNSIKNDVSMQLTSEELNEYKKSMAVKQINSTEELNDNPEYELLNKSSTLRRKSCNQMNKFYSENKIDQRICNNCLNRGNYEDMT